MSISANKHPKSGWSRIENNVGLDAWKHNEKQLTVITSIDPVESGEEYHVSVVDSSKAMPVKCNDFDVGLVKKDFDMEGSREVFATGQARHFFLRVETSK